MKTLNKRNQIFSANNMEAYAACGCAGLDCNRVCASGLYAQARTALENFMSTNGKW